MSGEADLHAPLEWTSRHKIAVGAARGMRFLHEDCRVGCIVHRDLRPSNILLTHDFEPLVGDFGLARCQHDGALAEETRVLGTFGYLAPEYVQTGQLTEKADVYSFGVILLELVTGRKAIDFSSPKGQQCLTEWARPLMQNARAVTELIDSRLEDRYSEFEVFCMLHASSLCLRRDPDSRPRMSQVLKVLEGDLLAGGSLMQFNGNPIFRSESMDELMSNYHHRSLPFLGDHNNEMLVPSLPGITTLRPLLLGSSMLNPIFGSHSASESPANSDIVIRKKTGEIVKSPSHQDAGSPGKLTSPSHRLTASLSSLGDGISFEQEEQQADPFTAITSYCSPFYIGSGDLSSVVSPSWSGDELSSSGSSRTLRQHKRLSIEALRSKYGIREKSKLSDA